MSNAFIRALKDEIVVLKGRVAELEGIARRQCACLWGDEPNLRPDVECATHAALRRRYEETEARVAELEERYNCNTALLHARTEEMNKAHARVAELEAELSKERSRTANYKHLWDQSCKAVAELCDLAGAPYGSMHDLWTLKAAIERLLLADLAACHAGKDGECNWSGCPQVRDNEPRRTGRHCPLDTWCSDCDGVGCQGCDGTGHINHELRSNRAKL